MLFARDCNCHEGGNPIPRVHVFDEQRRQRKQKQTWQQAKAGEAHYARQLRAVADQVDKLIRGLPPDDQSTLSILEEALRRYSQMLQPWADAVVARMLADVKRRDEAMWVQVSRDMGASIRQEITKAPTGALLKAMLNENVALITSLPLEAAQRVHELALKKIETSGRADEIAKEIMRTGEVTRARATLIARTEVARAASGLIEARSTHIGSEAYIWRSSEDSDVRNVDGNPVGSHRLLNGKIIYWKSPPVASTNGVRAHAGQIYNCRCWPEPILPDEF